MIKLMFILDGRRRSEWHLVAIGLTECSPNANSRTNGATVEFKRVYHAK